MKDFDKFFREKNRRGRIPFKLFDQEYSVPGELPAFVILKMSRLAKENKENGSDMDGAETVMELAGDIFGRENVRYWIEEKDLTMPQLEDLIKWVMEEYGEGKTKEEVDSTGTKK